MKRSDVGKLGEDLACRFLVKRGFHIVERNYRKFYGEIDIIAVRKKLLHFIEVKAFSGQVSRQAKSEVEDKLRPEDNISAHKIKCLRMAIETYLAEKDGLTGKWQFDVITVILDVETKKTEVGIISDIIL